MVSDVVWDCDKITLGPRRLRSLLPGWARRPDPGSHRREGVGKEPMRRYTQAELLQCYCRLYNEHPHALLPLETALPAELQYPTRDRYRTVLTMILSVRMADVRL